MEDPPGLRSTRRVRSALKDTPSITGAFRGYREPPDVLYGTNVRLFRGRQVVPFTGHAGIAAPSALIWIFKNRNNVDVVLHVHLGRHLMSMPAALPALLLKKRVIVQTQGMIVKSKHVIAPMRKHVRSPLTLAHGRPAARAVAHSPLPCPAVPDPRR